MITVNASKSITDYSGIAFLISFGISMGAHHGNVVAAALNAGEIFTGLSAVLPVVLLYAATADTKRP